MEFGILVELLELDHDPNQCKENCRLGGELDEPSHDLVGCHWINFHWPVKTNNLFLAAPGFFTPPAWNIASLRCQGLNSGRSEHFP
jgi:hypothetical protein